MKRTNRPTRTLATTLAVALASTLLLTAPTASAADYEIDGSHSVALFRVKHLNAGFFWGVFHKVSGKVVFDAANPASASVNVEIDPASVFTANRQRDDHLKGPDFFNVTEFPKMTFESTAVRKTGENTLEVTGKLTMLGVTREVKAAVEFGGEGKDPWGNMRAGWEARLTVKRSEFGMKYMPGGLGEEVQLIISIEGTYK